MVCKINNKFFLPVSSTNVSMSQRNPVLSLPLFIDLPRKTKKARRIYLNLNCYRNLKPIVNNQTKVMFKEIISNQLINYPVQTKPVKLLYTLYPKDNRVRDTANALSIIDKFTSDALVEACILTDDNYKFVTEITFRYGGLDKLNPRATLEIIPQ